jgi:glycosyltransferase involved in cell wall biosynthesis
MLGAHAQHPMRWIYRHEAKWLARFEARAARCAFATVVVNERERSALREIMPEARVEVVRVGVDAEYFQPAREPAVTPLVVFCGVMNYAPNAEGAVWLARDVWPLVRRRVGDARLAIVGSQPTAVVRRLAETDPSVEVTGAVSDVRPYLWKAAVATAPLHVARGVQFKVLEAVAARLPAVVTPEVAGGLPAEVLTACRVAQDPVTFSEAIANLLLLAPHERRRIACDVDLSSLSWNRQLAPLVDLLHSAALRRGESAPAHSELVMNSREG